MTNTPSFQPRHVLAAFVAFVLLVVASCSQEQLPPSALQGSGGGASDSGAGASCLSPAAGCDCDTEGQHARCGEVVEEIHGQTICGPGNTVCTNGKWSECVINYAELVAVPDAPPGYYPQGFGAPTPCTNNPCDPYCVDYPDTPGGLSDAGTNLNATDSGLTPTTDAGALPCGPKTCLAIGANCGTWGNGCGGMLSCGTCTAPKTCGGAGTLGVCGNPPPACVPTTCAALGKNCGPMSDGCGNLLNCGSCQSPATCGGGGTPSVCGTPAGCTGLCLNQVTCAPGVTTRITGTVYAPNGTVPLPNVVVYVPNGAVAPFPSGTTCENCAVASGNPLVSTTTDVYGKFTIDSMPATTNVPLVIQVGRWRRQFVIPNVPACVTTNLNLTMALRFPRTKAEGDIPKIALSTGAVDSMECVLRKMGVADSEFTTPDKSGRIHFYYGSYYEGSYVGSGYGDGANQTPREDRLFGNLATLDNYDMTLFPCQGTQWYYGGGWQAAFQNNIAQYVNTGGRAFMTHYSYNWLITQNTWWATFSSPLSSAINWNINSGGWDAFRTGTINTGFARGSMLATWLQLVAGGTYGQIPVEYVRRDYDSVNPPTLNWLTTAQTPGGAHATFDTPLGVSPANQCGRVVFSDFHVTNANNTGGTKFPNECDNTAMTAQEKVLLYMLFDLASCVGSAPPPPPCVKTTCSAQGLSCGPTGDGCGGTLNCGTCTAPATCGGSGVRGQCGSSPPCVPTTCAAQGLTCGPTGDGCGGTLNCGSCIAPATCGGGGMPGQCGSVTTFNEASFVRTYDATSCPAGTKPTWSLWSWSSVTPADTHIDFSVQTAPTLAALASAPADNVLFSNPPGPGALVGQACSAHAANQPPGQPDTQLGSADLDKTFIAFGRPRQNPFVRVTSRLVPSADKLNGPLLVSWNLQVDCMPSE